VTCCPVSPLLTSRFRLWFPLQYARDYFHHYLVRSVYFPDDLSAAMRDAFTCTERAFLSVAMGRSWESGSTAVAALVQGNRLVTAHVGDCRAVLCRNGRAVPLTKDHSPCDPEEVRRIQRSGSFVREGMVCGLLGVARSLGDYDSERKCKVPGVCAEPSVSEYRILPEDEFMLVRFALCVPLEPHLW
jgi:protein phosphatase PTC2/3